MIYISTHCMIAYIADEDVYNEGGNVDKVQEEPFGEFTIVWIWAKYLWIYRMNITTESKEESIEVEQSIYCYGQVQE